VGFICLDSNTSPTIANSRDSRSATSDERIKNHVAFVRRGEQATFYEGNGLLGWVFAVGFFSSAGCRHIPHAFHLLAAVGLAHQVIVEAVFALFVLSRPENGLSRMRKIPARKIWGRVRLFPSDVVQNFEPQLLHRVANGEDDMLGAADPNGAVRLEDALAATKPFKIEFVIEFGAA